MSRLELFADSGFSGLRFQIESEASLEARNVTDVRVVGGAVGDVGKG